MKTTIYNSQGQPISKWRPTEKFTYILTSATHESGLWREARCEWRFDLQRKWRFDIAFPDLKVAVEIDGTLGRHSTPSGEAKDNEKLNRALELGWKVFRYNSAQLGSKQKVTDAVEQVVAFICNAKAVP